MRDEQCVVVITQGSHILYSVNSCRCKTLVNSTENYNTMAKSVSNLVCLTDKKVPLVRQMSINPPLLWCIDLGYITVHTYISACVSLTSKVSLHWPFPIQFTLKKIFLVRGPLGLHINEISLQDHLKLALTKTDFPNVYGNSHFLTQ